MHEDGNHCVRFVFDGLSFVEKGLLVEKRNLVITIVACLYWYWLLEVAQG
jgi:hypothetical protein